MTREGDWRLDGQRSADRVTQQEELQRKSSLCSKDRDKLILAWVLLMRSVENQRGRDNGFKIKVILFQA